MTVKTELTSRKFHFGRADGSHICDVILADDGVIVGPTNHNEKYWAVENGILVFQNDKREVTTIFDEILHEAEPLEFRGSFLPLSLSAWHILAELTQEEVDVEREDYGASSHYVNTKMAAATPFDDKMQFLTDAMNHRSVNGLILEFGVYKGATLNHLAEQTEQQIYGFDVFSGLPESWRFGFSEGAFRLEELPKVHSNVQLVVGLFGDTLGPFLDSHEGVASLIHVDCDLYSSTKTIFERLASRIVEGTVIVFDEYLGYPGWREHEYKAFQEYMSSSGRTYSYLSYVRNSQQVAVQITG